MNYLILLIIRTKGRFEKAEPTERYRKAKTFGLRFHNSATRSKPFYFHQIYCKHMYTHSLNISIDFGTKRTGYGYAYPSAKNEIYGNRPWLFCPNSYVKTATELLLNKQSFALEVYL